MKKTTFLLLGLSTATLLLFTACGGGGSTGGETPPTTPPTGTKATTVPQKINIDIPNGLKANRNAAISTKASLEKSNESIPSYGYERLKSSISEAEERIKNIKHNMVYLNSMMSDIETECTNVPLNTQCTIPAGKISLSITNEINEEISKINEGFKSTEDETPPVGTKLTLGQVLYTKFDTNHTYQHHVILDLQPTFSDLGANITKQLETIKWSDDNNSVQTISDYGDEDFTYKMQLLYTKEIENNIENMTIADSFKEVATSMSGSYSLYLKNLNDVNNTFTITTNGQFITDSTKDNFNSKGQISDNGGFLSSTGSFGGETQYAEKETFDKEGNVLKSIYCDGFSQSCDLSDESTWHTFDDIYGIDYDYSDINETDESFYVDFNDTYPVDDEEYESGFSEFPLTITGGNIPEGICTLLPPTHDTTNIENGIGIWENSIGSIFKYEEDLEGYLYDSNYLDALNTIKIICLKPTEDGLDANLVELTGSDRPTLAALNE